MKTIQVNITGTRDQLDDVIGELQDDGYTMIGDGTTDGPKLDLVMREIEDPEDAEDGVTYSLIEVEQ